jgi:hypothetical protein
MDTVELAREIAVRMAPDSLLDSDDIGAMLKCDARYVTEHYALLAGFPKAIRLPTRSGGRGHPRWLRADVAAWLRTHIDGNGKRGGKPRLN